DAIRDRNVTGVQTCALPISKNLTNDAWLDKLIRAKRRYSSTIAARREELEHAQEHMRQIERETDMTIAQIKEINRRMSIGEAKEIGRASGREKEQVREGGEA